jgi:YD repeat-containing protein
MTKRFITLTLVLLLLLSPTTGIMGISALATDGPTLNKEQMKEEKTKAEVQQAIVAARKNAIYDKAGRMSKVTIDLPRIGKFDFEYKYDGQNRLQYILDGKGRRTQYKYGESGELRSITLPNGTRMYELDKDGQGVFFKDGIHLGRCDAQPKALVSINSLKHVRAAIMAGDCGDALAAAVIATAAAAVACIGGNPIGCAVALAAAALAVSRANKACKDDSDSIDPIDGPIV